MKIVIVSGFYSEGMGYSENSLPKALASLGHEVHVITSNLNVYGTSPDYHKTYESFLGPADQGVKTIQVDGYTVHRLPSKLVGGYVYIRNMYKTLKKIQPDIVQSTEIASVNTFLLAAIKPLIGFKLFTETHQHMSVMRPYMKNGSGSGFKRLAYRLTRTFPSWLAAKSIVKCYAIAPDCVEVAHKYYGVPEKKIVLQPLGTDTDLFAPAATSEQISRREELRTGLGYSENDVVCIYTGRFSKDKDPLLLAKAVDHLAGNGKAYYSLFIGEGPQKDDILQCRNAQIIPFMKHQQLADYYRSADIAIWPTQESLSMLDAASVGLPLVVSDTIGEKERVNGNGSLYAEGNVLDLAKVLQRFEAKRKRTEMGEIGREKMIRHYSWINIAQNILKDYELTQA